MRSGCIMEKRKREKKERVVEGERDRGVREGENMKSNRGTKN